MIARHRAITVRAKVNVGLADIASPNFFQTFFIAAHLFAEMSRDSWMGGWNLVIKRASFTDRVSESKLGHHNASRTEGPFSHNGIPASLFPWRTREAQRSAINSA